jgi:neurolysin
LKKQKYGNSINRFRRYFEIENVVENTFKIYEELLGLKFREIPEA